MSYFSRNKLISFIILAMLIGLLLGYLINTSITKNKFVYDRTQLENMHDVKIKKQTEQVITKFEEKKFMERKKEVASRFSILSDIFLHMIKMIIAPLVLAVLVLGLLL
jgi:Na+/H+-dicarboxylate symporter